MKFLRACLTATAASGLALACLTALGQTAPAPSQPDNATAPKAAVLGKLLFFDPRLSGDNKMSCATCHVPEKAFTDGLKTAQGAAGQSLKRNTQSVLNLGLYSDTSGTGEPRAWRNRR